MTLGLDWKDKKKVELSSCLFVRRFKVAVVCKAEEYGIGIRVAIGSVEQMQMMIFASVMTVISCAILWRIVLYLLDLFGCLAILITLVGASEVVSAYIYELKQFI